MFAWAFFSFAIIISHSPISLSKEKGVSMKQEWSWEAIARAQRAAAKNGTPVPKHIRKAQSKLAKQKNLY